MKKSYLIYLILGIFAVPFCFMGFHDTHLYGDDWAQYVKEASNIAQGKPYYESGYVQNPTNLSYAPAQYPPGYPLLLAPVVACYGLAMRPMLWLNTFIVVAALFAAYYYYRGKAGKTGAVCLSLILIYGSWASDLKGQLLSDIPCMLFALLYLGLREREGQLSRWRLLLLSAVGAFAILIRTQAILLIAAELVLLLCAVFRLARKPDFLKNLAKEPSLALAAGMSAFFLLVNNLLLAAPPEGLGFYLNVYMTAFRDGKVWVHLGDNTVYLLDLLKDVFYHSSRDPFGQALVRLMICFTTAFGVLGIVRLLNKKWTITIVFLLLNCLMLVFTPVRQGVRYFLPAAPAYIWAVAEGIMACVPLMMRWKPRRMAIVSTIAFIVLGYDDHELTLRPPKSYCLNASDTTAFRYIARNVPDSALILFVKPRLLHLYTGKRTMVLSWYTDLAANRHFADSMGAGYLLYARHNMPDGLFYDYLRQPGILADSVMINDDYTLYHLKKAGE